MTHIITYSLKPDAVNSDEYYRTISTFAGSWLARTTPAVLDLVTGFRAYRLSRGETDRSDAEYTFELLALGVLIREHGEEAGRLPGWIGRLMQWFLAIQNRQPRAEKMIKVLRGWLGWIASRTISMERRDDILGRLLAWLGANDESTKAKRFGEWRQYFDAKGNTFTQTVVPRCLELAEEFARSSREALGKYTVNVEDFLAEEVPNYRRRYDAHLLAHTRLEYHLGMLGTEILSRAYRQRFLFMRSTKPLVRGRRTRGLRCSMSFMASSSS